MTTAFYSHADCRAHDMGRGHPECPQRLDAIQDHLQPTFKLERGVAWRWTNDEAREADADLRGRL